MKIPEKIQAPKPDRRLRKPMEALAAADPDIARAYADCGLPPVRASAPGFPGLIRMIAGQQVSVHAAAAIMARLEAILPGLHAGEFINLSDEDLKAVGFSRPKMRYGRLLAEEIASGRLDIEGLQDLDDEGVLAALTAVTGIGRWTAEIYLLFALGRPDVMPAGDLALCVAAQHLKRLESRPDPKALTALAEAWRPHRSAAARFLWHYYRHPGVALASAAPVRTPAARVRPSAARIRKGAA